MPIPNDTAAKEVVPANCPTIMLSEKETKVCPNCEIITGIASFKLDL